MRPSLLLESLGKLTYSVCVFSVGGGCMCMYECLGMEGERELLELCVYVNVVP